jgi:hypothetical protein
MKKNSITVCIPFLFLLFLFYSCSLNNDHVYVGRIIDHQCIAINKIPVSEIENAKKTLHIAYGHTSHGSQLTTGMDNLDEFMGGTGLYTYNNSGTGGALDLREPLPGDCGYYPQWVNATRAYLGEPDPATGIGQNHPEINVIIWSWCGQVSSKTEETMINEYLDPMSQLETDYPGVTFVYMTGHLDGTGLEGNLHLRNEQIRRFCSKNNRWLYDFADIETYDPDGTYFGEKIPNDKCEYDSNNDDIRDATRAIEWQDSHTEGVDWYSCSAAHTQPVNANMKAYAAWWTWAAITGWTGE